MHPTLLVVILAVLCGTAHAQRGLPSEQRLAIGSLCTRNDGQQGVCKKFEECQEAVDELKKGIEPTVCFFDRFVAVPCCPAKGPPTVTGPAPQMHPRAPVPAPTSTQGTAQRQPPSRHEPTEDWSPSPVEERSLLQLAQQKCIEYQQYVYEEVKVEVPLGEELINKSTCGIDIESLIGDFLPSPREFPHMAAIGYGDANISWLCGGSLISSRHILTAAHCIKAPTLGYAQQVLLGALLLNETNTYTQPQKFNIVRWIRHPRYKPPQRYNDIGILELDHDVNFTGFVRPACLYDTFTLPDNGIATGFGNQNWFSDYTEDSKRLMKITLPIQPYSVCNKTYSTNSRIPNGVDENRMLCVGDLRGDKHFCQGNSGGPLQLKDNEHCMYKIIGITSFGNQPCGAKNAPIIFTRVSSYIPWIAKIIWT